MRKSHILERPVDVSNMKPSLKGPKSAALPLANYIVTSNN